MSPGFVFPLAEEIHLVDGTVLRRRKKHAFGQIPCQTGNRLRELERGQKSLKRNIPKLKHRLRKPLHQSGKAVTLTE
jgi:hypothetical protein